MSLVEGLEEQIKKEFGISPKEAKEKRVCWNCRESFSDKNTFTEAGRKEAEISGLCEKCFDTLFDEDEDD